MRRSVRPLVAVVLLLAALAAPGALAHVGGSGGGASFDAPEPLGAPPVREFLALPESGGARYHRVELAEGERVRVLLAVPPARDAPPSPALLVAGPGLPVQPAPEPVALPPETGHVRMAPAAPPRDEVLAWVPARVRVVVDDEFVAPASGAYVFVAYDPAGGGRVAVLVEHARFSWLDWFRMSTVRAEARAWGGAGEAWTYGWGALGALAALAPFAPALRRRWVWSVPLGLAAGAAALAGASGALALADAARMGEPPAAALAPGAAALALAWALVAAQVAPSRLRPAARVATAALALAALLVYAGFLWGPVAALVAAIVPDDDAAAPPEGAGPPAP